MVSVAGPVLFQGLPADPDRIIPDRSQDLNRWQTLVASHSPELYFKVHRLHTNPSLHLVVTLAHLK